MGCAVNSRSFVDLFFKRCDWFVFLILRLFACLLDLTGSPKVTKQSKGCLLKR